MSGNALRQKVVAKESAEKELIKCAMRRVSAGQVHHAPLARSIDFARDYSKSIPRMHVRPEAKRDWLSRPAPRSPAPGCMPTRGEVCSMDSLHRHHPGCRQAGWSISPALRVARFRNTIRQEVVFRNWSRFLGPPRPGNGKSRFRAARRRSPSERRSAAREAWKKTAQTRWPTNFNLVRCGPVVNRIHPACKSRSSDSSA
jgi:hypothetical protein